MKTKKQLIKINNFLIFLTINFFIVTLSSLGATLNAYTVLNNDCRMPVQTGYYFEETKHFGFIEPNEVNSYVFSDIIDISTEEKEHYISIGDVLIYIAIPLIFVNLMVYLYKSKFV